MMVWKKWLQNHLNVENYSELRQVAYMCELKLLPIGYNCAISPPNLQGKCRHQLINILPNSAANQKPAAMECIQSASKLCIQSKVKFQQALVDQSTCC